MKQAQGICVVVLTLVLTALAFQLGPPRREFPLIAESDEGFGVVLGRDAEDEPRAIQAIDLVLSREADTLPTAVRVTLWSRDKGRLFATSLPNDLTAPEPSMYAGESIDMGPLPPSGPPRYRFHFAAPYPVISGRYWLVLEEVHDSDAARTAPLRREVMATAKKTRTKAKKKRGA